MEYQVQYFYWVTVEAEDIEEADDLQRDAILDTVRDKANEAWANHGGDWADDGPAIYVDGEEVT